MGVNGEDDHSNPRYGPGHVGGKVYKTTVVEAEILYKWRMRYNSGKVDWGHTVLTSILPD